RNGTESVLTKDYICGAQVGERKKTFVYGGINEPGRRIINEPGLIDATKVQVFAQIEMAKPRSDAMMSIQIAICSSEDSVIWNPSNQPSLLSYASESLVTW
ncbi:hypothetical protein NC652_024214, partial [Populus alba x Populus x berolinensis]